MNGLPVLKEDSVLVPVLVSIETGLQQANNDFERITLRDKARKVQEAAVIIEHRGIQTQASILVQQAERAIAKANPANPGGKGTSKGNCVIPSDGVEAELPVSPTNLRNIRQAHDGVTDDEFAEIVADAAEKEEPLSRKVLADVGKRKRRKETREERDNRLSAQETLFPTGQLYTVLLADPPWEYDFSQTSTREIANHYPTMPLADIKALEVAEICHVDAVLYLWATAPKLPEALEVMTAWGFTYKSNAVWIKDKIGMGYWWRNQHEHLLIGTRGSFPAPAAAARMSSVIHACRGAHSVKPVAVAEHLETLYPDHAKIELFARKRRAGWAVMGNEIDQLSPVSVSCVSCSR